MICVWCDSGTEDAHVGECERASWPGRTPIAAAWSLGVPEWAWAAYVSYWQKAAERYAQEFGRAAKLAGGLMNRRLAAIRRQMEEATTQVLPLEKAA